MRPKPPLSPAQRALLEPIAADPRAWVPLDPRQGHFDLERAHLLELRNSTVNDFRPAWRAPALDRWTAHITDRGRKALAARDPLVVYHARCFDGFTAAWAVWRALERRAELLPASYGDAPPEDVADREVVIVDFSYSRPELEALAARASSLLVLDHHRTAQEALEGLPYARFDLERSGAALAWDHFHGGGPARGMPRPWLVEYVQDRDLWRWQLLYSREVSAYLRTLEPSLELWDDLAARHRVADIAPLGAAILRYQEQLVQSAVRRAGRARLPGFDGEVPCVNATELISEIGNELSREAPFAIVWFEHGDGDIRYSLRSSAENPAHVDVSSIARALGGGGHRHAAGVRAAAKIHETR